MFFFYVDRLIEKHSYTTNSSAKKMLGSPCEELVRERGYRIPQVVKDIRFIIEDEDKEETDNKEQNDSSTKPSRKI